MFLSDPMHLIIARVIFVGIAVELTGFSLVSMVKETINDLVWVDYYGSGDCSVCKIAQN